MSAAAVPAVSPLHAEPPAHPAAPGWVDADAYPFAHRWQRLRRGWMHFVDEGRGPPVLFVHGTPTWSFEWRHLIRGLAPERRCVAPDHLGFGLSERPAGLTYSAEEHAENLAEFVDRLGLESFDLVVHDYGGPIGLPLALDGRRRVRRLVLVNTWMWSFDEDKEMQKRARMVSGALGRWMYRRLNASLKIVAPSAYGDRRKLTKEIHGQYLSVFPDADGRERVLWALARGLLGERDYFNGLWARRGALAEIPTLIAWGLKDSAFRPHQLARWQQALPRAKVVTFPESGHWPHEEEPRAVLDAIDQFLRS